MPVQGSSVNKEKKPDNKQVLLDLISKEYGHSNAIVMEKALKTQDKQIEQAMLEGGKTADQIGQVKGIDMNLLDSLLKNSGNVKATGDKSVDTTQPQGGRTPPKHFMSFPTSTQDAGWGVQLLSLLAGAGLPTEVNNSNLTKGVYGFDTMSGKLNQIAEVPANADIRNMATGGNSAELLASLPSEQQMPAAALAKKFGVRNYDKIIPTIVNRLKEGVDIDKIEDEIRMSQQSVGVSGEWRNAAQSILGTDVSESQRNVVLDALDDYRQAGDDKGAKEYLKNIARESADVDIKNRIYGKERTIELLDEIQGDVNALEKAGIGTGFLRGNMEGLMNRIGKTVAPKFREVATKIAIAIFNYRNTMSGVAFGAKETADYKRVFPSGNNVNEMNTATITALNKVFKGDTEKFYQQRMGSGNYNKLFGGTKEITQDEISKMSDDELKAIIAGGK